MMVGLGTFLCLSVLLAVAVAVPVALLKSGESAL